MDLFDSISPIDFRHYGRNENIKEELAPYLSEKASIRYSGKVEAALANAFAEQGFCPREIAEEIEKASEAVTAEEVYEEEDRIRHSKRSLVNCIRNRVSEKAKPYVHLTATSNDVIDTADAARYRDFTNDALIPKMLALEKTLIDLARREKETKQIGRTHGQFAEPITFGFSIALYVSRVGGRILKIRETANDLRGKLAGAVGAYNAQSVLVEDPVAFERLVLSKLGLKPSPISSQVVEAEFMTDFIHAIISAFGVVANIADDMRNLQRSEIGEVREFFDDEQVGSSTMPQKRNPVTFERIKSIWKTMMPRMATVYADQISEHQRDLTNLESSRFVAEILAMFYVCVHLCKETMSSLTVDRTSMKRNLDESKELSLAEPVQILLGAHGHPSAHECAAGLASDSRRTGVAFSELLIKDKTLESYLNEFEERQSNILKNPDTYIGIAVRKVEDMCCYWEKELGL